MRRASVVAISLALGVAVAPLAAQTRGVRFDVMQVSDTTLGFRRGAIHWIRPGDRGMAVDPRRHDALIARLRVIAVDGTRVTALITGQTTAVTMEHVVVMQEPRAAWYRSRGFWSGLVLGVAAGVVAGRQL